MKKVLAIILAFAAIAAQTHPIPRSFTRYIELGQVTMLPVFGLRWPPPRQGDDWHYAGIRLSTLEPVTGP